MNIGWEDARQALGMELNALAFAAPPSFAGELEGARIGEQPTPVHDLNGEVLFYRVPVADGGEPGYADTAARDELGAPLLAVSTGFRWDEGALLEQAAEAARSQGADFDEARFVAYSFPKVGVQFRARGEEVMLLELFSWEQVPEIRGEQDRAPLKPSNFERWSLLDELPADRLEWGTKVYEERVEGWKSALRDIDTTIVEGSRLNKFKLRLHDSRELHFDGGNTSHHTCFELHGQETNLWCVGASTQMLLAFYRYEYSQDRIAQALGLGTKQSPNGLPYSRVEDVVTQLEALSSNGLEAAMVNEPDFDFFSGEIDANRPLISFIPGHSRAVAGYIQYHFADLGTLPFRGLLVYDPWPPATGVITRWENWDTQIYLYGYRAHVKIVP